MHMGRELGLGNNLQRQDHDPHKLELCCPEAWPQSRG